MRTIAVFVAAAALGWFPASASVESQLKAHTQELMDALAPGNARVWDRYLDSAAVMTSEDGNVQSKQEMLRDLRPLPEGVSGTIAVKDFHAYRHGAVVITSHIDDENENYHGQMLHCQYRTTDTWLQTSLGWRIIASHVLAMRADPPSIALEKSLADQYVGRYALTPSIEYEIRWNGGRLEGQRSGGKWEPLVAEAPDVLFVPGKPRYRKVIQRDSARNVVGFTDRREAWDLLWKRVP